MRIITREKKRGGKGRRGREEEIRGGERED